MKLSLTSSTPSTDIDILLRWDTILLRSRSRSSSLDVNDVVNDKDIGVNCTCVDAPDDGFIVGVDGANGTLKLLDGGDAGVMVVAVVAAAAADDGDDGTAKDGRRG
jgi:hypothetical protein